MAQRERDDFDMLEQEHPQGISAVEIVDFFAPRGVKLGQWRAIDVAVKDGVEHRIDVDLSRGWRHETAFALRCRSACVLWDGPAYPIDRCPRGMANCQAWARLLAPC